MKCKKGLGKEGKVVIKKGNKMLEEMRKGCNIMIHMRKCKKIKERR